jgi:hypothetical protein
LGQSVTVRYFLHRRLGSIAVIIMRAAVARGSYEVGASGASPTGLTIRPAT